MLKCVPRQTHHKMICTQPDNLIHGILGQQARPKMMYCSTPKSFTAKQKSQDFWSYSLCPPSLIQCASASHPGCAIAASGFCSLVSQHCLLDCCLKLRCHCLGKCCQLERVSLCSLWDATTLFASAEVCSGRAARVVQYTTRHFCWRLVTAPMAVSFGRVPGFAHECDARFRMILNVGSWLCTGKGQQICQSPMKPNATKCMPYRDPACNESRCAMPNCSVLS